VDAQDWQDRQSAVEVPPSLLNRVVMNYLISEGYEEGAARFAQESGLDPGVDLTSVAARIRIKNAVVRGDLDAAIQDMRQLNPGIVQSRKDLLFALKRQKLIELIRCGDFMLAVAYARSELAPLVDAHPDLQTSLEEAMACLLLFNNEDCSEEMTPDIMSTERRVELGGYLNNQILTMQQHRGSPSLAKVAGISQHLAGLLSKHGLALPLRAWTVPLDPDAYKLCATGNGQGPGRRPPHREEQGADGGMEL